MIGPLTYLDIGLLAVAFISGILAMYRGFTRELLSIISWAIAGAAVLYFVLFHKKFAEDMATQTGTQVPIAQIAIGAVIFLIVLIIVHLITARISDAILDSRVGMVDRVFGLIFGVLRGFLLVVIPYMFYLHFIPDETKHFDWVRNSQSLPYLKSTGLSLQSVLVNYLPSSLTDPETPPAAPTGEQQG
jgi:membrane protein required for colicin V production